MDVVPVVTVTVIQDQAGVEEPSQLRKVFRFIQFWFFGFGNPLEPSHVVCRDGEHLPAKMILGCLDDRFGNGEGVPIGLDESSSDDAEKVANIAAGDNGHPFKVHFGDDLFPLGKTAGNDPFHDIQTRIIFDSSALLEDMNTRQVANYAAPQVPSQGRRQGGQVGWYGIEHVKQRDLEAVGMGGEEILYAPVDLVCIRTNPANLFQRVDKKDYLLVRVTGFTSNRIDNVYGKIMGFLYEPGNMAFESFLQLPSKCRVILEGSLDSPFYTGRGCFKGEPFNLYIRFQEIDQSLQ